MKLPCVCLVQIKSSSNDKRSSIDAKGHIPLAERVRPTELANYVGQKHVLGEKTVLLKLLEKREIPSMILWGPPGCGKVRTEIFIFAPHARVTIYYFNYRLHWPTLYRTYVKRRQAIECDG